MVFCGLGAYGEEIGLGFRLPMGIDGWPFGPLGRCWFRVIWVGWGTAVGGLSGDCRGIVGGFCPGDRLGDRPG